MRSAFHPETMGSIERHHHSLVEYLKMFAEKTDWDFWLRLATFSYNTGFIESHGYSPHQLVFGTKARLPNEFFSEIRGRTYSDYLDELILRLNETQKHARERLIAAKEKSKRLYDLKLKDCSFNVDDVVLLLKEPKEGKLDDQYTGPYTIKTVLGDANIELDLGKGKTKIVHPNTHIFDTPAHVSVT